jgi:hypothetical protein
MPENKSIKADLNISSNAYGVIANISSSKKLKIKKSYIHED